MNTPKPLIELLPNEDGTITLVCKGPLRTILVETDTSALISSEVRLHDNGVGADMSGTPAEADFLIRCAGSKINKLLRAQYEEVESC